MAMLEVNDITISYGTRPTVKNFSMSLEEGKICSLVGESGSGKTTVIRAIFGLLPGAGKVTEGDIIFAGDHLLNYSKKEWRKIRGTEMSMIFQDSGAMMNPTKKVGAAYTEYIRTHENISKKEAVKKGIMMLERMRLPSGDNVMQSYPFQLSGGMRQRVGIAMGMTYQPKLLVRQMMELKENYGTAIILVTHNLGVAAYMSDHIIVMRNGVIEDQGDRDHILYHSENAYTHKLLEAVPSIGGTRYV